MPTRSTDDQKPAEEKPAEATAAPRTATRRSSDDEKPSSGTAYLNVSGGPLVYDRAGHTVAAGEWTPEINLDKLGKAARQNGYLLPRSEL